MSSEGKKDEGTSWLVDSLGPKLLRKDKDGKPEEVDTSSLEGKRLMLYFSAHWCPPCRRFTPVLAELYSVIVKEREDLKDDVEVVFISADRDLESYNGYYGSMPWHAVPFNQQFSQKIGGRFGVNSYPTLLILDAEGNVVQDKGVNMIMQDSMLEGFPWATSGGGGEVSIKEAENHEHKTVSWKDLKASARYTALYASASWCPPCRKFSPILQSFYESVNKKGEKKTLEVVLLGGDRTEGAHDKYFSHQPWLAVPYSQARNALMSLGIQSYPTLIIVDNETGEVCTRDGYPALANDPSGFPFKTDLNQSIRLTQTGIQQVGNSVNSTPLVLALTEKKDEVDEVGKLASALNKAFRTKHPRPRGHSSAQVTTHGLASDQGVQMLGGFTKYKFGAGVYVLDVPGHKVVKAGDDATSQKDIEAAYDWVLSGDDEKVEVTELFKNQK